MRLETRFRHMMAAGASPRYTSAAQPQARRDILPCRAGRLPPHLKE
jgi:hypothetical protein